MVVDPTTPGSLLSIWQGTERTRDIHKVRRKPSSPNVRTGTYNQQTHTNAIAQQETTTVWKREPSPPSVRTYGICPFHPIYFGVPNAKFVTGSRLEASHVNNRMDRHRTQLTELHICLFRGASPKLYEKSCSSRIITTARHITLLDMYSLVMAAEYIFLTFITSAPIEVYLLLRLYIRLCVGYPTHLSCPQLFTLALCYSSAVATAGSFVLTITKISRPLILCIDYSWNCPFCLLPLKTYRCSTCFLRYNNMCGLDRHLVNNPTSGCHRESWVHNLCTEAHQT